MTTLYVFIAEYELLEKLYYILKQQCDISDPLGDTAVALCWWLYEDNTKGLGTISNTVDFYLRNPDKLNRYPNAKTYFIDFRNHDSF